MISLFNKKQRNIGITMSLKENYAELSLNSNLSTNWVDQQFFQSITLN